MPLSIIGFARFPKRIPTYLALIAVVGLSGSMFPQTSPFQTPSTYHSVSIWSVGTFTGFSSSQQAVTKASVAQDSITSQPDSYGSQQLQLANRQDSEGVLYEDYRSRRSRIVIYVEIARRLVIEPLALTDIALLAKVNFSEAKTCLERMMMAGLVRDSLLGGKKYALTRKGLLFLESGERTLKLLQPESEETKSTTEEHDSRRRTLDTH